MHPTPIFQNTDKGAALAFAARFPFAVIAVNGEQGPVTALVPLVFDETRQVFLGHVAKSNPFWKTAQRAGKAVSVFRGPDAYISPSSYPSKADHHKAVPTWNYMAVEIRGEITVETDPAAMEAYLKPLTETMESRRDVPWKMSDAPADYMAKLSNAIIGFTLSVGVITFVEKLSQNKSAADREGMIADLNKSQNVLARELATCMAVEGHGS